MPEIALPAFHVTATRKLTIEVSHDLAQDLERYRTFYKQAYSADVSEADLLREMARRFMNGDREFQITKYGLKARSRTSRQAAAPSPAPAPKGES
jgi:hypothetical protein